MEAGYPQSYPQVMWIVEKTFMKPIVSGFLQESPEVAVQLQQFYRSKYFHRGICFVPKRCTDRPEKNVQFVPVSGQYGQTYSQKLDVAKQYPLFNKLIIGSGTGFPSH